MATFTLRLAARPPFRLDLTVWALRRRPHNEIDRFDGRVWRRVLIVDRRPVAIAVTQTRAGARPAIEAAVAAPDDRATRTVVAAALARMLRLDLDLAPFYRMARGDRMLAPMAARLSGMRPPRFPSVFEAFGNAVACQQVSLTAGLHVLNRVAAAYGRSCKVDGAAMNSFPDPRLIAPARDGDLRALGLSYPKARYLIGLAQISLDRSDPDFASLEALDDAAAAQRLLALRGVGRWTAEYVMLRGLGRLNVFPADDVGGTNKLCEWLGVRRKLDYEGVRGLLQRWHPYQGLIYLHLLVDALAGRGLVASVPHSDS
jgi:DNA-3-methyladenine glycosylase II